MRLPAVLRPEPDQQNPARSRRRLHHRGPSLHQLRAFHEPGPERPLFGALTAMALGGETISVRSALGMLLTLAGMGLIASR